MKKFYYLLLSLIIFFTSTITTEAASYRLSISPVSSNATIVDLGNGYYGSTSIECQEISVRATGNKTGSKTYNIINSSGSTVATFKLTASFSYSSSGSVTCKSATYSTNIKKSGWSFTNSYATKSGKTAYGSFTATYKILGISTETISQTITLTCDKYGNLS